MPGIPPNLLFLDLETTRNGYISEIGATLGDQQFHAKGGNAKTLADLADFAGSAGIVVGHNLAAHDLPLLLKARPQHPVLRLPILDTLLLSPLCFPENPYHKLLKDYKIVRDSLNDPVADCRLCAQLLADESKALVSLQETSPGIPTFYRQCLVSLPNPPLVQLGTSQLFDYLGIHAAKPGQWKETFADETKGLACQPATEEYLGKQDFPHPQLAYALAWLRVAGANSVIPHWVTHKFPRLSEILHGLRDVPCKDPSCIWCRTTHSPQTQLQAYFGFKDFRPDPPAPDGSSLQGAIVQAGMQDKSLLAILPTGGGKSLGFQLPALVRHKRRGSLTIVVSPLQALMKDQVDNLRRLTGMHSAIDSINGLQTLPERGASYEKIILGDTALLYVSPEQLRNKHFRDAISKREIGCWVFDEAHCLSKWGHDFRPDYLFAGRFIRELTTTQGLEKPPPIACFTATAKQDVKEELIHYFQTQLGIELEEFDGGTERTNLEYTVRLVKEYEKPTVIHEYLSALVPSKEDGGAVVFCATRKNAREMAGRLLQQGWAADYFHAGLTPDRKTEVLEGFNRGDIHIICATNAFGMGVDKPDIRLVIHTDIPGSLENYIQEAGRGGRDQLPAMCVLLYNPGDMEKGGDIDLQFSLDAMGRISRFDIRNILKGVRTEIWSNPKSRQADIPHAYLSSEQILRDIHTSFEDESKEQRTTKVYTALANLEHTRFLERNENQNRLFQGVPLIPTMEEAMRIIRRQNLHPAAEKAWVAIYRTFLNLPKEIRPAAEDFVYLPELVPLVKKETEDSPPPDPAVTVFKILNQMASPQVRLIKKDTLYSATLRHGVANSSKKTFQILRQMEGTLLRFLQELAPDAAIGDTYPLHVNNLTTRLQQEGFQNCIPEQIHRLLEILRLDGTGLAGENGSLLPKSLGQGRYQVKLQRSWQDIQSLSEKRLLVAQNILDTLHTKIPAGTAPSAHVEVDFEESELIDGLLGDLETRVQIRQDKFHEAIEHGLRYLHESRIIRLENGRALITQAMRLDLIEPSNRRQYNKADHQPLEIHYQEKNLQIHVMAEYAQLGAKAIQDAIAFLLDYFTMEKADFIQKHFKGRQDLICQALSEATYARIVESLRNPYQQAIVCEPGDTNLLILAGPGSGKSRTVAHRCAHLLCVDRIPARRILVLCYNRSAASTLRRRIRDLAGPDARGITIATFHSLAMRLLGISPAEAYRKGDTPPDFEAILSKATQLLNGGQEIAGLSDGQILHSLVGNWSHILIDEYQDIDQAQYDLVSAIAGRTRDNPDTKLSILAVGDDDQNIYAFRDTSTRFIRNFQEDYDAKIQHLVENYRSTQNIIHAANTLISDNHDRMKADEPIRINHARREDPPGAPARILQAENVAHQASALLKELQLLPPEDLPHTAILGRNRTQLHPVRAWLETNRLPVRWACGYEDTLPLHRIREFQNALQTLQSRKGTAATAVEIHDLLLQDPPAHNPWLQLLHQIIGNWHDEAGDAPLLVDDFTDYLHTALLLQRKDLLLGQGIHIGTAHGAKGLEFKHVFLLDGGWDCPQKHLEDERRLYYVAMTRAMESLQLFQLPGANNPFHKKILQAQGTFAQTAPKSTLPAPDILARRYTLLGMKDLFLDLAGQNPHIAQTLSQLTTGTPLLPRQFQDRAAFFTQDNQHVATLSQSASDHWVPQLPTITSAQIHALVRREKSDCQPEYQPKCLLDSWEVPIIEVIHDKESL
jgi:ATP-dependent DNA helicase RecQ